MTTALVDENAQIKAAQKVWEKLSESEKRSAPEELAVILKERASISEDIARVVAMALVRP